MFETLGITASEFQHFLLVFMRITAFLSIAPIFSDSSVAAHFRALMGMFISFMIVSVLPVPDGLPLPIATLIFFSAREVLVGILIGWACEIIFDGVRFVGFITARMMGLSMMTIMDPSTDQEIDVISQIMYFVAFLALLTVNGHHFFLQSLFDSFYLVPLTKLTFGSGLLPIILKLVSSILVVGIKIGAPVYLILFLVRVVMALFAKITPDIQILIVGMPLTIMVGFYILTVYWPYYMFAFLKHFNMYKAEIMTFVKTLGGG